jgi:diguanylate cyclase (GGDEF)-like protein/PAS domain S-box-containing protein
MDKLSLYENDRTAALCALGVLDTPAEERFDQFTTLAAAAFGVPIALISLIDHQRQWFKSRHGLEARQTPRSMAFCAHTIEGEGCFLVEDAALDARFCDNPLVTGAPHIRFYAGQSVHSRSGHAVGTLCIIDTVPRTLDPAQRTMLGALAALVEAELNRDSMERLRQFAERALHDMNAALELRVRARSLALDEKNEALNREVRQRADVEASLRHSEERMRAMVDASFSAFVATDETSCIVEWNKAAERMFGWRRAQVLGRPWSAVITSAGPGGSARHQTVRQQATTRAGRVITVEMRVDSYVVQGQMVLGVFMHEVTELDASQEQLRQSEQMLRSITENLPTLIGKVDRQGRFAFLNSRSLEFFRMPAEKLLGQSVRTAYSEDDYAKIEAHVDAALAGRRASFESEVVNAGGTSHYHAAFVPQFDEANNPDGFLAMAFDISSRRRSELAQRDSEERLRTITDNVPVLISYVDRDLRYQFANAMYKDWLGVASKDMLGRTVAEVFGDDYYAARASSIAQAMGGNMSSIEVSVHRKGHERILNSTYMPHYRDGAIVGVYVLATDATAARSHERKLLALANADPLTNLPNRRMFEFHLVKALALARRQQTCVALMYLDLDDFKRINDTHGHAAGDAVLVEFGRRVAATLRESDLLARLAGDEFTVVLEAVDSIASCEMVARKIHQALHAPFLYRGAALTISASIGVALGDGAVSQASLGAQADAALYAAKRAGKSRFAVLEAR